MSKEFAQETHYGANYPSSGHRTKMIPTSQYSDNFCNAFCSKWERLVLKCRGDQKEYPTINYEKVCNGFEDNLRDCLRGCVRHFVFIIDYKMNLGRNGTSSFGQNRMILF